MQPGYDYKQYAILFVDDEDKALKYFRLAYGKEFRILTAASVAEALEQLRCHGDGIGVLLTDQRMPEQTGVELLKHVRRYYPGIIRILTTAYSELNDAIEAVNRGEIYRYVTKPWDIQGLRTELRQAMEFYLLRRERDLLLEEKLNVLQRMVQADRARDLIVMAGALGGIRHALQALHAYFAQPRRSLPRGEADGEMPNWMQLDFWSVARTETNRSLGIGAYLANTLRSTVAPGSFPHRLTVPELVGETPGEVEVAVDTDFEPLPPLGVDGALAKRLFGILLSLAGAGARPPARLKLSASLGTDPGPSAGLARIEIALDGNPGPAPGRRHQETHLLAAYFIAYHHGGRLQADLGSDSGPRFFLELPIDPSAVTLPAPPDGWLDEVFSRYEGWDE